MFYIEGRTLSQIGADALGTNTQTIHIIGLAIAGALLVKSKQKQ